MADLSQLTMPLPAASPQQLQRELLESARQLSAEAAQFAGEWQGAWPNPTTAGDLTACVEAMRIVIDRLVAEFGRPGGPAETEVAGLIGDLLGTTTEPGPLRVMQALTHSAATSASLEEQKLLGEVDVLRIQFNVLRTQWQDYLSMLTAVHRASGPQPVLRPLQPAVRESIPPPALPLALPDLGEDAALFPPPTASPGGEGIHQQPTDAFSLHPKRRRFWISGQAWRGLGETFITFATLGGVLLVIIGIAYLAVSHQPQVQTPATAAQPPALTAPPATLNPTNTSPPAPTDTPLAPPTSTTPPEPTVPAAPGQAQLTVNPTVLLVPCPGSGAGTLQLVNTGTQPLNWRASVSSASGGKSGIVLDVAQGHLEAQGITFINVTALAQGAQGTISISYTGAASAATVTYSVSC
jgi:hypothetical protein